MALNIVSGGGSYDPYVKYNGKAGRWYVKKDEHEVEVANPTFVADFENIKLGWFKFTAGMAPDKVFDPSLNEAASKPSPDHKRGFELRLFSKAAFGGVVALSGASMHLNAAISDLHTQYEEGVKANAGKLPVVKCTGTTPMKDKQGTNYKPNFVIEKWVARPAEFDTQPEAKQTAASVVESDDSEF